ncbi:SDR family NAD(P)-dependent oxidoreductase [Cupriavidus basilensis]
MQPLQGNVALVTGAGSGIGRANCVTLAARGAALIVNDVNEAGAHETVALVRAAGGVAVPCIADVSKADDVERAFAAAQREAGPVQILVNNAGIPGGMTAFEDIDEMTIDRMFSVTVRGTMLCTRAVLPGMKRRGGGCIINTSSITAFGSHPRGCVWRGGEGGHRQPDPCLGTRVRAVEHPCQCGRAGARGNADERAVERGSGILQEELRRRVPLQRRAVPAEIAAVVAFLASADASYMTGQVLSPNGGEIM